MSRKKSKTSPGFLAMPRSLYVPRTKPAVPERAVKSSSAMSTRTYSRMNSDSLPRSSVSQTPNGDQSGNEESMSMNESYTDLEELRNEKELLDRMLDQQKQLQELKERQRRVLMLQKQLADMESTAEESLEEKLGKLHTAKTRLDELQQLVTTIKSAEVAGQGEGGDNSQNRDKATKVRKALRELTELKDMIGVMSSTGEDVRKPAATMEPVFANAIQPSPAKGYYDADYQSVLPEVSVVQFQESDNNSPSQSSLKSPKRKSKDYGHHATNAYLPYQKPNQSSASQIKKVKKSAAKSTDDDDPEDVEATLKLFEEMNRHQQLLRELRERKQELENLMSMASASGPMPLALESAEDYNNASIKSTDGSNFENRSVSEKDCAEDCAEKDCVDNQSGQLFGLSDADTARLIDLIRNQKLTGAMAPATDKTTATWGSSTSGSNDDDDDDEEDEDEIVSAPRVVSKSKASTKLNRDNSSSTSVKDAFTQMHSRQEHEIDFRPPTRRRRNITQPDPRNKSVVTEKAAEIDLSELQDQLSASNSTMHVLLEDQQALSKLLLNASTLQRSYAPSKMCYGISPDFLIYQLDNCSAQFAAILEETKELQWRLYSATKDGDFIDAYRNMPAPRNALSTLPNVLNQRQNAGKPAGNNEFCLQAHSPAVEPANLSLFNDISLTQPGNVADSSLGNAKREVQNAEADLFEALRDSIYSEAAILISQNESRPHFLVELFHTLQRLDTDFLRQHALYALQDVVRGYLPGSPGRDKNAGKKRTNVGKKKADKSASCSENTPSESGGASDDAYFRDTKPKMSEGVNYDFSLKVSSASELSSLSDVGNAPFADDDLGDTVIHLDAALRHMREVERRKQELMSVTGGARKAEMPQVDTKLLRAWIKNVVSEIIPVLKANHDRTVDDRLLRKMRGRVFRCVAGGDLGRGEASDADRAGVGEFFARQLKPVLDQCLSKFAGRRVGSCGEDVIVSLSEVLFNELAFFYMMRDLSGDVRSPGNGGGDVSSPKDVASKKSAVAGSEASSNGDEKNEDSEVGGAVAKMGNAGSHGSPDPVTLDLSVSETKPLTSYGSGEDEEDGSGDDYDYKEPEVCTSMQQATDSARKPDSGAGDPEVGVDAKSENAGSDRSE